MDTPPCRQAARAHWHELVGGYLQTRACLRGVILIMDVRIR